MVKTSDVVEDIFHDIMDDDQWHKVISARHRNKVSNIRRIPSCEYKVKYKTVLCKNYMECGYCRYNENCQFAHGIHELRTTIPDKMRPDTHFGLPYKRDQCSHYKVYGICYYGSRCNFIHTAHRVSSHNVSLHGKKRLTVFRSICSTPVPESGTGMISPVSQIRSFSPIHSVSQIRSFSPIRISTPPLKS